MTVRFGNHRLGFYIVVFLLSGTVLGLAANFASIFLPIHRDFIIFSLVVSALTIFTFLLTLQWSQPNVEGIVLFVLGVLWLAMGAWSTDIIGNVQCDALGGQKTPAKNGGETNAQTACYQMKVTQAFSWALFCLFVIALYILFQLTDQARRFGRYHIWSEPIRELPWFGEMPGYYNTSNAPYPSPGLTPGVPPMMPGPQMGYPGYPGSYGGHPGSITVISPGVNGGPANVTSVPMTA